MNMQKIQTVYHLLVDAWAHADASEWRDKFPALFRRIVQTLSLFFTQNRSKRQTGYT
jgi:hypothetical protein